MVSGSERNVPVGQDPRTFEERRRDMVSNVRQHHGVRPTHVHYHNRPLNWVDQVNRWTEDMYRGWEHDMNRMHRNMFTLLPIDLFHGGPGDIFTPHGDISSMIDRMDRQMRALSQHVNDNNGVHPTIDHPGALVPRVESGTLDYLRDAYELGEDGKVRFKLIFNLKGYGPEDIQVRTTDNGLNVHAKKIVQTDTGSSAREYSRTIYLPETIDRQHLECHLTKDGVLALEAPVLPEKHKSYTLTKDHKLAIKPHSEREIHEKTMMIQPIGVQGATVQSDEKTGARKVHVEIPIDPEFTADDLNVRMEQDCVIVSGRKEISDDTPDSKSFAVKEFTRSYGVPGSVDTFAANSQLKGNTLLIEAPLMQPSTSI